MRLMPVMIMVLLVSACVDASWSPGVTEQNAQLPAMGNDAQRDGFYDGGVFDPDLTRRTLPLPE